MKKIIIIYLYSHFLKVGNIIEQTKAIVTTKWNTHYCGVLKQFSNVKRYA